MYNQLLGLGVDENAVVYFKVPVCSVDIGYGRLSFDAAVFPGMMLHERVAYMQQLADFIYEESIQGSIAECGVNCGDFAKYMIWLFPTERFICSTHLRGSQNRTLYMSES
jgi:hypothetical protein